MKRCDGLDLNALRRLCRRLGGRLHRRRPGQRHDAARAVPAFIEDGSDRRRPVRPSLLMRPAWGEYARRPRRCPRLAGAGRLRCALRRRSLLSASSALGPRAADRALQRRRDGSAAAPRCSRAPGRSNDFRRLQRKLVLVATDLDSGDAAPFGHPGLGPRADLAGGARQRRAARAVPAGADRRPLLRRRRAEEDAARPRAARRRRWTC